MWVVALDARHHIIRKERITIGLADRSQVHAREVFRVAIRWGATRVIIAHNHPSGDPSPSQADMEMTKSLVASGKLIGIDVIDHVIIGYRSPERSRPWFSCKEANMLS
jgi:DNA repair protein RadC